MDLRLAGNKVLVTGASKGIGRACALAFAREGAQPTLVARDAQALALAAEAIAQASGIRPSVLALDLTTTDAVDQLLAVAGDVDILVNNAGAIPGGDLAQVDDARWRQAWELKVYGYIKLTRAYLPRMEARGSGVIANVIGMAGVAPRYDYLCGGTANAALNAFTCAVGAASPRRGVRVFGVNPSLTRTDRVAALSRQMALARLGDAERWPELSADLPFGRLLEAEEVADLLVFACSSRAAYLSGSVIDLDGGQLCAAPSH